MPRLGRYRWQEIQLACYPPLHRAVLVDTRTGARCGTVGDDHDGLWRLLSPFEDWPDRPHFFATEREAKQCLLKIQGIDPREVGDV